jgi:hypothetical protein
MKIHFCQKKKESQQRPSEVLGGPSEVSSEVLGGALHVGGAETMQSLGFTTSLLLAFAYIRRLVTNS